MPGIYTTPAYRIYQFIWSIIDWLYPPHCAGCNAAGYRWCPECKERTKQISFQLCEICGNPNSPGGRCWGCVEAPPNFDKACSWAELKDPLRKAVLRLKYKRDYSLGDIMSAPMVDMIDEMDWQIDLVVPVPLGKKRLSERGYNQAASLARPLAWSLKLSYEPNALKRIRETESQVGLTKIEREKNVFGAFKANQKIVDDKRILLVDDVMTTGATLEACALALKQAHAKQVFGISLSRATDTRY